MDCKVSKYPIAGGGLKGNPYEILGAEPVSILHEVKVRYPEQMRHYQQACIELLSPEMQNVAQRMVTALAVPEQSGKFLLC